VPEGLMRALDPWQVTQPEWLDKRRDRLHPSGGSGGALHVESS
jgi:hypothetical protein